MDLGGYIEKRLFYGVYFISGASALIFETLWFHQAGLAFGNSVWASSLVLSGFMAGLAVGSVLAARYGDRLRHPIRAYVLMELLIALTGVGLIYTLPALGSILGPLLSPWADHLWVINSTRLTLVFFLLLIPSTAMGMTLPLLTKVLLSMQPNFGAIFGKLYGWNTLGAVLGVALSETYLMGYLGIHGTGLAAAGLGIAAASVALGLARTYENPKNRSHETDLDSGDLSCGGPYLTAAFLSGFCLLALEVIWFRFLSLYVMTTSLAFAEMLAVVLAGIGSGGLAGSFWLSHRRDAFRHSGALCFLTGALCVAGYAGFSIVTRPYREALIIQPWDVLRIGIPLMFPVAFLSGGLFVLLGAALRSEQKSDIQTTGSLTLANTIGAALGSLIGGFIMLPTFGMERSFFIIALIYGCNGVFLQIRKNVRTYGSYTSAAICIVALAMFPFGVMQQHHLQVPAKRYGAGGTITIEAIREGLTETLIFLKKEWFGKTVAHKMITNSFSMSGTAFQSRRYMKLYVYLPVCVHPNLKKALLISYGVGSTAKALTDTRSLETIDIVDISRDVLDMNRIIYPNPMDQPLRDPRVRVHIEDGRYFLQTSKEQFDLITGEPPPPRAAGVVNLYTQEYFQLMSARLAEGGLVTYWLPMHSLSDESAKSILKSFCAVFEDCSLWTGMGPELMMVGTRNARGPVSQEYFMRQWNDPTVRDEMKDLGFEKPEQLGALFIGDAGYLHKFLRNTSPLVDNFPKRITASGSLEGFKNLSIEWTNVAEAKKRFSQSPFIERLWPGSLRSATLPYFDIQGILNLYLNNPGASIDLFIPYLHRLLTETRLETPVVWLLGGNPDLLRLLKSGVPAGMNPLAVQYLIGIRALSDRKYADAAVAFERAEKRPELRREAHRYFVYSLCLAGQVHRAQQAVQDLGTEEGTKGPIEMPPFWLWMKKTFGIHPR